MRTKVAVRTKVGKDFIVKENKRIEQLSKLNCEGLARKHEQIIGDIIVAKSKHPTGYLASFFYADEISNGWGIGNIEELDREAPYWAHLDKGSEGIGADRSHYLPKGRWVDGRWVEDDLGYWVKHTGPIPAQNYIAETMAKMEAEMSKSIEVIHL